MHFSGRENSPKQSAHFCGVFGPRGIHRSTASWVPMITRARCQLGQVSRFVNTAYTSYALLHYEPLLHPKKLSLSAGHPKHLHLIMVIWAHLSPQPTPHLDRLGRFCTAEQCFQHAHRQIDHATTTGVAIPHTMHTMQPTNNKKPSCRWGTARARYQLKFGKYCTNVRRIALE